MGVVMKGQINNEHFKINYLDVGDMKILKSSSYEDIDDFFIAIKETLRSISNRSIYKIDDETGFLLLDDVYAVLSFSDIDFFIKAYSLTGEYAWVYCHNKLIPHDSENGTVRLDSRLVDMYKNYGFCMDNPLMNVLNEPVYLTSPEGMSLLKK